MRNAFHGRAMLQAHLVYEVASRLARGLTPTHAVTYHRMTGRTHRDRSSPYTNNISNSLAPTQRHVRNAEGNAPNGAAREPDEGEKMIRRDIGLDADRPHYYSQFWVDVASGKRTASAASATSAGEAPEAADELDGDTMAPMAIVDTADLGEAEVMAEAPAPEAPARPAAKKAEPKKAEPARPALTSLADLAKIDMLMKSSAEMDSDTIPDIEGAATSTDDLNIVTDFDPSATETQVEEPLDEAEIEFGDDYDEEDDWGEGEDQPRRGSKPNKRRETRREPRRDF